ncbi:MAG: transporter substrate-binding domain-containing protein [Mesorhizobium sp.]|nr:transporter substrate-binding domain-containing protein [Mesorhizobium sp.]
MKKLVMTVAALAFGAGTAFAQDVVRIGTEGAYPPYNFINDDNELDGFEREFGDALCERAGLNCEWVINDWDTIIPNLVGGNYDMIMAGMSITEPRRQVIQFTQNYMPPDASAYLALEGADDSVIDGVVAVQSNTMQAGYVAETDATLVEFPTPDETIAAVRSGEADAVMADKDFLIPFTEQGELVFIGDDVPLGDGLGVGLRQSDNELRETLDASITEMKEDGSLNELILKWFGEDADTF